MAVSIPKSFHMPPYLPTYNKLKSLEVAQSKDDGGRMNGCMDDSVCVSVCNFMW